MQSVYARHNLIISPVCPYTCWTCEVCPCDVLVNLYDDLIFLDPKAALVDPSHMYAHWSFSPLMQSTDSCIPFLHWVPSSSPRSPSHIVPPCSSNPFCPSFFHSFLSSEFYCIPAVRCRCMVADQDTTDIKSNWSNTSVILISWINYDSDDLTNLTTSLFDFLICFSPLLYCEIYPRDFSSTHIKAGIFLLWQKNKKPYTFQSPSSLRFLSALSARPFNSISSIECCLLLEIVDFIASRPLSPNVTISLLKTTAYFLTSGYPSKPLGTYHPFCHFQLQTVWTKQLHSTCLIVIPLRRTIRAVLSRAAHQRSSQHLTATRKALYLEATVSSSQKKSFWKREKKTIKEN